MMFRFIGKIEDYLLWVSLLEPQAVIMIIIISGSLQATIDRTTITWYCTGTEKNCCNEIDYISRRSRWHFPFFYSPTLLLYVRTSCSPQVACI